MKDIHYYSNYASTHDIDCFFRIGDIAYHFASHGHPIPSFVLRNRNRGIQIAISGVIEKGEGEVETRRETIRGLITKNLGDNISIDNYYADERREIEPLIDDYASTFEEMARVGFVSMDLDENEVYHIIAEPKGQKLPNKLLELLPEVGEGTLRIE